MLCRWPLIALISYAWQLQRMTASRLGCGRRWNREERIDRLNNSYPLHHFQPYFDQSSGFPSLLDFCQREKHFEKPINTDFISLCCLISWFASHFCLSRWISTFFYVYLGSKRFFLSFNISFTLPNIHHFSFYLNCIIFYSITFFTWEFSFISWDFFFLSFFSTLTTFTHYE